MTQNEFVSQLSMMLRDVPRGTTADLNDCLVAYWNGYAVVFGFLSERGSGEVDEEFDLNDYQWEAWRSDFEKWVATPAFSVRPEVLQWMKDAPPHEASA